MKLSNKFLSDYVYLAEASYADYSRGYDKTNVEKSLKELSDIVNDDFRDRNY